MKIEILLSISLIIFTFSCKKIDITMPEQQLNEFLAKGSMGGFYTYEEFWDAWSQIRGASINSRFTSERISIGKSFEGRDIFGFYLTDDATKLESYLKTKNIVLLNSLHHSREPLTLTMVILVYVEILKLLRSKNHSKIKEFFRDNTIFIIPVINIDSYIFINKHFNDPNKEEVIMIRKNRHLDPRCNEISGGVDLNRNYEYKFGLDNEGSSPNPCDEDYRGSAPFSEPETSAIKNYINEHQNVVSAINLHSYGNSFIYPFGFLPDKTNQKLVQTNPLMQCFFEDFRQSMISKNITSLFGNTPLLLGYSTNGEGADWLAGKKAIFGIDFELGNSDTLSEQFYPPKQIISGIVRYDWILIKEFLYHHNIEFSHRVIYENSAIAFEIMNLSPSTLTGDIIYLEVVGSQTIPENEYKMEYCVKQMMSDKCDPIPVLNNEIGTSIKGRHIIEVRVEFRHRQNVGLVQGLKFIVRRSESYMDYKDQKFLFKAKN